VEGITPADITEQAEKPGYGTEGKMAGTPVRLGRPEWIGVDAGSLGLCTALAPAGGHPPVVLTFEDSLRPGAQELIGSLQGQGLDVVLLSGDHTASVAAMSERLGVSHHAAEMLPTDKVDYVKNLTDNGHRVLMVGDGLNDTGALAAAHVSISPAQALDAARAASDIVLLGQDLSPVADAIATARLATKRINENFTIATVYNVVAVPLAVAGLATPLIAALAMSISSITVSVNALRVRGRT
jgi:Cu2+-exporting ATPase